LYPASSLFCLHFINCSNLSALDTAAGCILKRNLVSALDTKMWDNINALHVVASYLDPSFKGFSFARDAKEIVYQNKLLVLLKRIPCLLQKNWFIPQKESEDSDVEALGND